MGFLEREKHLGTVDSDKRNDSRGKVFLYYNRFDLSGRTAAVRSRLTDTRGSFQDRQRLRGRRAVEVRRYVFH